MVRRQRQVLVLLLGPPRHVGETTALYETNYENVVVTFAKGQCGGRDSTWKVAPGTIVKLVVAPRMSFLLSALHIDDSWYKRKELLPVGEIADPPTEADYIDEKDGITIRTSRKKGGTEEVVANITYGPAKQDDKLRCY